MSKTVNEKIDWEGLSFGIITKAGEAKSIAMEALNFAKKGSFKEASKKLIQSNKLIGEASHKHFDVIAKEANGEQLDFKILFIHAEDQLLTTQTLILLVEELIDIHKKIA